MLRLRKLALPLLAIWFLLATKAFAQNAPDPISESKEPDSIGIPEIDANPPRIGLCPQEQDPVFEQYVDVMQIGRAINEQDAANLAELASKMAQGERILLRPHRSIAASALFQKAIQVAAAQRDQEAFEILLEATKAYGDKSLTIQVAAAQKLATATRSADAALQLNVQDASVEQFATLKGIMHSIAVAKTTNNRAELMLLKKELPTDVLTKAQQDYVARQIEEAENALPQKSASTDAALAKLAAASRGIPLLQAAEKAIEDIAPEFDPTNRYGHVGKATDEARGRTHVPVYFQNNTPRPITVVMMYQWKVNYGGLSTRIRTIPPYKKIWVANNYGQSFRYLARDDKGRKWHGSELRTFTSNGKRFTRPFHVVNMGGGWRRHASWTQRLNN